MRPSMFQVRLPCKIKLTRIAPRFLDKHDNLPMSMKYIVDALCEILKPGLAAGRADEGDDIEISYDQIKLGKKEYAVRIAISWNN